MSISSELVLLQQDITNARTAITTKGGTITPSGGSSQLATDIATIPTGITPSGNIALTATTSTQTGIDVTNYATASVAPTPSESKTLTLGSAAPATVDPSSGKLLSSVPVSIDNTVIKAENIAQGATILGIAGTHSGGITPTGTINITTNGTHDVTQYASANVNVSGGGGFPAPMKYIGTSIVRNTDSLDGAFDNATSIGSYAMSYAYYDGEVTGNVSFPNVTSIDSYALNYAFYSSKITSFSIPELVGTAPTHSFSHAFYNCSTLTSLSMPKITSLVSYSMDYMCQGCTNLTSLDLSGLTSLDNNVNCIQYAFKGCNKLETVNFNSLATIPPSGQMRDTFQGCTKLKDVYFNALSSVGLVCFGSSSSYFTFNGCTQTGFTIHFPASMQSVIEGVGGYSSKWGATNAQILFDL